MNLGQLIRTVLAPTLATGLVASGLVVATAGSSAAAAERRPPARIALPNGFQPEGIAIGRGPRAYVGSLADGDIYRFNVNTGRGQRISQGDGTPAVGMKFDARGRLWAAGGADGDAKVVNTRTGRVLRTFDFADGTTFVNDVVLRGRAAWFTDSQRAVLYKVAPRRGKLSQARVSRLPLKGAWNQVAGQFNANGISTTPDGRALLVVQSVTGRLFRVDPQSGRATRVRIGYTLTNGDGLLRRGNTLYVAQNRDNKVAVLRLGDRGKVGRLVRTLSRPGFDVPTTIARYRDRLYLPNARFTTTPTPTTPYWVTKLVP